MTQVGYAIAFIAVAMAAALQGSIGIGFSFLVVPVLALVAPELLPTVVLLLLLPLSLAIATRERFSIDTEGLGWIVGGRLVGTALAVPALGTFTPEELRPIFGAIIVVMVAISARRIRIPFKPVTMTAAGFLSGLFSTLAALGGPPLAILYSSRRASELRSTLGLTFALGLGISLIGLAAGGKITGDQVIATAQLAPAMLVGFVASKHLYGRLDQRLQPVILGFAAIMGVVAIFQ